MVIISQAASLPTDGLAVFHTTDSLLSQTHIFAFYGVTATSIANPASSSRIQCHIFTPAGLRSYPRLAVSPSSPFYDAVKCLSREEQGDEVCRGLAFTLLKYFSELPEPAKNVWVEDAFSGTRPGAKGKLFSADHAASLASRMQQLANGHEIIQEVNAALTAQSLSYLDADISLPAGLITVPRKEDEDVRVLQDDDAGFRYGQYAPLMRLFGEPLFIPTSKVRRAPSRTTAVNHGTTFLAAQKLKVAREVQELVQTEERYVSKVRELAVDIANDFREASQSDDRDASICATLFPDSLQQILELNSGFLEEVQALMLSEDEQGQDGALDAVGLLDFTNCLLKWMPRFAIPYTQYIQAHAHFGSCLKEMIRKSSTSTVGKLASDLGERRLMSMLIEPVQRLPRYSLYADNIIKQLPLSHPGLKQLLAVKDIVANVCAQDSASSDEARLKKLKDMVALWPTEVSKSARLVCAVDAREQDPPYSNTTSPSTTPGSIILLFTESLVLLRCDDGLSYSSRALLSELDASIPSNRVSHNLTCADWWSLSSVNLSEINDGKAIVLAPAHTSHDSLKRKAQNSSATANAITRIFSLENNYEGKAAKFISDFTQARVEGRYTDNVRESSKWEARSFEPASLGLGLVSAISERHPTNVLQPQSNNAPLQIIIDVAKHEDRPRPGIHDAAIVASIMSEGHGFFSVEIEAAHERPTRDLVTTGELMPVLIKRITVVLQMRNQIRNPLASTYIYQHNQVILNSMRLYTQDDEPSRDRSTRSQSPVKALSSLFSSASSRDIAKKASIQQSPFLSNTPTLSASTFTPEVAEDHQRKERYPRKDSKITLLGSQSDLNASNPLLALETTFSSYILALRNRKGNVVGKVVARRNQAPQAEVNELYNVLLEDPDNHEVAAQAPVDVLFAAFEKFLKTIWKQEMGLVVDKSVLDELEAVSSMYITHDLDRHFRGAISRLAPQNQRALVAMVNLLEDLLSGMAYDGDKGMLTAAFAEIIVEDGDPRDFIPLLDQLVYNKGATSDPASLKRGSVASFATMTAKSTHNASLRSKAASLSKRFGFGSLRKDNSKSDLSFTDSAKPTMSNERDQQVAIQRPAVARSSSDEEKQNVRSPHKTPQMQKIYDAGASMALDPIAVSPFVADLDPFRTPQSPGKARPISNSAITSPSTVSPSSKSPTKLPRPQSLFVAASTGSPKKADAEVGRSMTVRTKPSVAKENAAPLFNPYATIRGSPMQHGKLDASSKVIDLTQSPIMPIPPARPARKSPSPGLRGVLCEHNDKGNTPPQSPSPVKPATASAGSPTRKLRIKSPQKAREQSRPPAIASSDRKPFADELRAITADLCKVSQQDKSSSLATLAARLQALGSSIPATLNTTSTSTSTQAKDSALIAAKHCITMLETQLSQADKENSALYDRTNKELMGIFEQVKSGHGVDELRRKLREEMEEGKKAREEVRRLRRENAMLRAANSAVGKDEHPMLEAEQAEDDLEYEDEKDVTEVRKENLPPNRLPVAARKLAREEKSISIMGRGRPMRVDHV